MSDDRELLRTFAETRDERAFADVVQRHIGFVYAISLRRLHDPHAAQDATQAVFVALARKAGSVAEVPNLMGWLHRSACYETRNLMRAQVNRLARETEAHRLGTTAAEIEPAPVALEAELDDALNVLSDDDRGAILARYFSKRTYAEIGVALSVTENAARMRVDRALVKLRAQLERRGITSTAAALASALPAYASTSVPSGLIAIVTKASVVGAVATAGGSAVIGFMSTAKIITAAIVVTALGGFVYEHQKTSELEKNLVAAREENAASAKLLRDVRQEIAALRERNGPVGPAKTAAPTSVPASGAATDTALSDAAQPGVIPKPPKGWFKNGSATKLYEVGVDANNSWGGMPSAYARSTGDADGKFGGMMQTISAEAYQNQRVRLTGWMKTEGADDGGGHLWLRIDGQETGKILGFDNMNGRAPKGTTDWQEYSIVLDVPPTASTLNYGFFVEGKGKMWVNGVTITPVGQEVASTNIMGNRPALSKAPVNLGFAPPTK